MHVTDSDLCVKGARENNVSDEAAILKYRLRVGEPSVTPRQPMCLRVCEFAFQGGVTPSSSKFFDAVGDIAFAASISTVSPDLSP